jgi:hypothetical protein
MLAPGGKPRSSSLAWRVFWTAWLIYSAFWTPYLIREHFPVLSLVENGTLNVENYAGWTDDIFRSPAGGAYINNNPGASLTAAVPLLLLRPILVQVDEWNRGQPRLAVPDNDGELFWRTLRDGRAVYFMLVEFLTVALVMAPLTAASAAYLCRRLVEAGVPSPPAAATALLYALGTPVFFRAAHLNHNLLVCDAGLVALLLLWDPNGRPLSRVRAATAGLLAGYAVLCDYSGLVVVLTLAIYVWLRSVGEPPMRRWRTMAAYAGGVIPGVALLAGYQAWAFGSSYLPSQHYMAPTAPTVRGYRGFDWPSPALIWANFFDPRFGLFVYCPALLLAFAAPFAKRVRYRMADREMWVLFAYFGFFVLFCAANQYSWLQPSTGFRYLVPVVPALALLAVQASQLLSPIVRWVVAAVTCAESLALAASHSNDVREALGTIIGRKGQLLWMIRLLEAGMVTNAIWPWAAFLVLVGASGLIWFAPKYRSAVGLK